MELIKIIVFQGQPAQRRYTVPKVVYDWVKENVFLHSGDGSTAHPAIYGYPNDTQNATGKKYDYRSARPLQELLQRLVPDPNHYLSEEIVRGILNNLGISPKVPRVNVNPNRNCQPSIKRRATRVKAPLS